MTRPPSFFDIENRREEFESKLRAENYPVTLEKMARDAEEMHRIYQKTKDELKPENIEPLSLQMMTDDQNQRKEKLNKLGSTKGQEFDFSDFITEFYRNPSYFNPNLIVKTDAMISYRAKNAPGTDAEPHLQGIMKTHYNKAIDRLKDIRDKKPWLTELSERFMNTFQATFVGDGHRCIHGYEGLNFLDGVENSEKPSRYKSTVQLSDAQEKDFVNSVENITPLGKLPTFETELIDGIKVWNQDFNGWGGHTEAFMFTFKDRKPMIGYMNRSFADCPYEGEAWILFSEKKVTEYLVQDKAA